MYIRMLICGTAVWMKHGTQFQFTLSIVAVNFCYSGTSAEREGKEGHWWVHIRRKSRWHEVWGMQHSTHQVKCMYACIIACFWLHLDYRLYMRHLLVARSHSEAETNIVEFPYELCVLKEDLKWLQDYINLHPLFKSGKIKWALFLTFPA